MVLAAVRMLSSRRLMARSAESEAPISLSSRRPWVCSAGKLLMRARAPRSLDADRTHFLHAGHARQALLHAILLQGAHALLERHRDQLRHARLLGDELLQRVGGDQQLVQ